MAQNPYNDKVIYIGGYYEPDYFIYRKCVYKSTDNGENWSIIFDDPGSHLDSQVNSIAIDPTDTNTIYISLNDGILKSTDSGTTWSEINNGNCYTVYVNNSGIVYGGLPDQIITSTDGGDYWLTLNEGLMSEINSFSIDETNNFLYIGTSGQSIMSRKLDAVTAVKKPLKQNILSYRLFNNYPNPFNRQTVIRYQVLGVRNQVTRVGRVALEIYNILGQLVTTLVNEEKPPGEYTVFWNGKNFRGEDVPSGMYFYRLTAGDIIDVKKMILLR